jgi:hypothetical protein
MLISNAPTVTNAREAAEKMEAVLLQQLLSSAHLFSSGSSAPGASIRSGLFEEALAEAVAHGGGVGIAKLLEGSAKGSDSALNGSGARVETPGEAPSDPRHV